MLWGLGHTLIQTVCEAAQKMAGHIRRDDRRKFGTAQARLVPLYESKS
jgi:hypothetical protein